MTSPCDRIGLLASAEISDREHSELLAHLAGCDRCAAALHDDMQLAAIEIEAASEASRPPLGRLPHLHRPARRAAAAAAVIAAAAAAWLFVRHRPRPEPPPELALRQTRSLELRVTFPQADHHRPYDVVRSGEQRAEPITLETLAALERADNRRGLAAAHILRGDPKAAERALAALPDDNADAQSDRAAAALAAGDAERALILGDRALAIEPQHPQALWNRALALRQLGLPLEAAAAFARVAELGEPGWSEEAAQRSAALRGPTLERIEAHREAYHRARAAIVSGGVPDGDDLTEFPGIGRLMLYDALRAATSPAQIDSLAAPAATLDAAAGGHHLRDLVTRLRRADWKRRAPLAARYADVIGGQVPRGAELQRYLARLRAAGADDILFGVLLRAGGGAVAPEHLAEYRALAKASHDPWLELLAEEQRGKRQLADGAPLDAIETLEEARKRCSGAGLGYRCAALAMASAEAWLEMHRPARAIEAAAAARRFAAAGEEHYQLTALLHILARAAVERGDVEERYAALARAYLGELSMREPGYCQYQMFVHRMLALIASNAGDVEAALESDRRAEEARRRCHSPLDPGSANIRAQILGQIDAPEPAVRQLAQQIRAARASTDDAGDRADYDAAAGRALIRREPGRGRALLERAVALAEPLARRDEAAKKTRAYAYAALAIDAARRGDADRFLELLASEIGVAAPRTCAVGVAWDEGPLAVAIRRADGTTSVTVTEGTRFDAAIDVPAASLADCALIDVIARPPHQGRPGLLPSELPWRYLTGRAAARPPAPAGAPRLVVADVPRRPDLDLPRLAPWRGDDQGARVLRGEAATPSRVAAAMRDAGVVEIHAHGLSAPEGGASSLVLAPEADGRFTLGAEQIAGLELSGAPLVILGACHAARSAVSFHASRGLAAAFLDAGARTVIASSGVIPDGDAAVLDEVRRAIAAGREPAVVLRDLRVRRGAGDWVEKLIVFE